MTLHVTKLTKTCDACPAQWKGKAESGESIFIHYRNGELELWVSDDGSKRALDGKIVYTAPIGGKRDGQMEDSEMKQHLQDYLAF